MPCCPWCLWLNNFRLMYHLLVDLIPLSSLNMLNVSDVLADHLCRLIAALDTEIPAMRLWPNEHENERIRVDL